MELVVTGNRRGGVAQLVVGVAGNLIAVSLLLIFGAASGLAGLALGGYFAASQGLPSLEELVNYRPPTVSTFYADDGTVIGRFFKERRYVISVDSVPAHVVGAVLAAEDSRFFSHPGVDWHGVGRALIKNLEAGYYAQGASTITQQIVRSALLTRERKLMRKMREAILSYRLEQQLGKKEILQIYLNHVYFGRGAYGIESAARIYFGKSAPQLNVAEAALLAGVVANPSRFSDPADPSVLTRRTETVLKRMVREGFISRNQYSDAVNFKLTFHKDSTDPSLKAPYFTDAVRRYMVQRYGADRLYTDGLRVYTTVDLAMQKTAAQALVQGAIDWEKRHNYPTGLVRRLEPAQWQEFRALHTQERYVPGDLVLGILMKRHGVAKSGGTGAEYSVELVDGSRYSVNLSSPVPYTVGDVLRFRIAELSERGASIEPYTLPAVEGALVSIENRTGYVRALVGGLDFSRSRFNRAVSGLRQPGSAFKPFLYAAAIERADYGPQTVLIDEPIAVRVSTKEPFWVPRNIDGAFQGPMPLRTALSRSRNVVAAKLILDVGVDSVVSMARAMGVTAPLRETLSLSLGTSEVTLIDMTAAYSVFANLGWKIDKVLVKKVVDRYGNVLEDNTDAPTLGEHTEQDSEPPRFSRVSEDLGKFGFRDPQHRLKLAAYSANQEATQQPIARRAEPVRVLSPETAQAMLGMLNEVCTTGTASSLADMNRTDIGGKTGTADDSTDAWFIGFNPQYTTGVWIGYDVKRSLGKTENGSEAALPIWKTFMRHVLANDVPRVHPDGRTNVEPIFRKAVYFPPNAGDSSKLDKRKIKRVSPVDWYRYRQQPEIPDIVTIDWVTLGYADTSFTGDVRILTRSGKTVADGYITGTRKVVAAVKHKVDLTAQQASAAGPVTHELDRF